MKKVTKKICASFLALAMVLGMCPTTSFAASERDVIDFEALLNDSWDSLGAESWENNFEGYDFGSGMFSFSEANAAVMSADDVEVDTEDPAIAALAEELEEVEVVDEEGNTVALSEEQIGTVLGMYQQYLDHWKANADTLGVQVPFFLAYNDNKEDGLGILGEMLALGNYSVEDVRNGNYSYDDLTGMIMNFMFGDQFGVAFYGAAIEAARDAALKAVKDSGAVTEVQKLLVLNDWLAHNANFDMSYIMNSGKEAGKEPMFAETPVKHQYYDVLYDEIYKVYEPQIHDQFYNQIYDGIVAAFRQTVYENVIKTLVYQGAYGQIEAAYKDGFVSQAAAQSESYKAAYEAAYAEAQKAAYDAAYAAAYEAGMAVEGAVEEDVIAAATAEAEAAVATEEAKAEFEAKAAEAAKAAIPAEELAAYQQAAEDYVASDEVKAEIDGIANQEAEKFMTENADAIAADALGFAAVAFEGVVIDENGTTVPQLMEAEADKFIATAETEGVEVDPVNAPGYKMTIAQLTEAQMDEPLDDLGGMTPNQAIPVYADQAAQGLTAGVLNYWQGSHIGVFGGGTGVCLGYSKAFTYLVQAMHPEMYGVNGAETDMSVAENWKAAADIYYDEEGNLDITKDYAVDMVRITFAAQVTMFGQTEDNFNSDHFWNAVKVDGEWYYVDPCYTDVFVEVMSRDRVETNGNMSHLYFMFSHDSAAQLYEGNYSLIKTLYDGENGAHNKGYEAFWTSRIASNTYSDGSNFYYLYDSTDMITLMADYSNSQENQQQMEEPITYYKLVGHPIKEETANSKGDQDYVTYIEFNYVEDEDAEEIVSVARVLNPETGKLEENEFLTALYAQHEEDVASHPSIEISMGYYDGKLYFNLSNRIMSYDLTTGAVETVKEYNVVYGQRDKTNPFGGMAFTITDEVTEHVVVNSPIAGMTIKADGNMYVDVATNYAFISGKTAVDDHGSYGYEFEETNFNKDYNSFMDYGDYSDAELEQYGYKKEINDNDEFMWSANFVETLSMSHIAGDSHTYENVRVDAHCGRNAYRENRCTACGASEAGSRIEIEGTALNHHYVLFEEDYYTKDENGNFNFGNNHVCTTCKKSYEEDEEKDVLTDADHVGHEYVGVVTEWNKDYTEATVDLLCARCYGGDLDCLLGDDTIELAEGIKSTDITKERYYEVVEIEVDEDGNETEVKEYFWIYTVNVPYGDETYVAYDMVEREEDKFDRNPFADVANDQWYAEAILWANEAGFVAGYEEDGKLLFKPNNNATRAESISFLWRMEGKELVEDAKNPFTDVAEGQWYYDQVIWAADNKITEGYEQADGTFTFRPNNDCTRAEILAFICRVKGNPTASADVENPFTDVAEGAWYYKNIMWAVEEGIVSGYEEADGTFTFRPDEKCTRAEIMQMLYEAFAE